MNTHLNILVKNDTLFEYPPLCVSNGYTAQYEHTIFLDETKKNIFHKMKIIRLLDLAFLRIIT